MPDTWEVALSAAGAGGGASRPRRGRLVAENKLVRLRCFVICAICVRPGWTKLVLAALDAMNATRAAVPFPRCRASCSAVGPALEAAM